MKKRLKETHYNTCATSHTVCYIIADIVRPSVCEVLADCNVNMNKCYITMTFSQFHFIKTMETGFRPFWTKTMGRPRSETVKSLLLVLSYFTISHRGTTVVSPPILPPLLSRVAIKSVADIHGPQKMNP